MKWPISAEWLVCQSATAGADVIKINQCSNEAGSGAKNQEQEQAGSGAEASAGSQDLLIRLLLGASV